MKKTILIIFILLFILTGCKNNNQKLDEKIDESNIKVYFQFDLLGNTFDKNYLCYLENVDFKQSDCHREIPLNEELMIYVINIEKPKEILNIKIDNNKLIFDSEEILTEILNDLDITKEKFEEYMLYYKKTYIDKKQKVIEEEFENKKLTTKEIEKEVKKTNVISKDSSGTISIRPMFGMGDTWVFADGDAETYLFKSFYTEDVFIYRMSENKRLGVKMNEKGVLCSYNLLTNENDGCDEDTIDYIKIASVSLESSLRSMHVTEEELLTLIKSYY